ncbi:MAG: hypothetical protein JXR76_31450 [Deltaproteobacteria bacterium]|nr:hypothetical protein [Deltaproteobacteria bacterium]
MNSKSFPVRLHVLYARDARRALVIRRDASRYTCVVDWHRDTGAFTISQWFMGQIYERRSDISPDGVHWIYFAMNGKWQAETRGAWTTVARTPWLKAVSLYGKGNCRGGGGLFLSNRTFWLNDAFDHFSLFEDTRVHRSQGYHPEQHFGGECPHVYYNRLMRDGWTLLKLREGTDGDLVTWFEKTLSNEWRLRKICHEDASFKVSRERYRDEHELLHMDAIIPVTDWEWADWLDETLVFCRAGGLYRQQLSASQTLAEPVLIHDFNPYTYRERILPLASEGEDDLLSHPL